MHITALPVRGEGEEGAGLHITCEIGTREEGRGAGVVHYL